MNIPAWLATIVISAFLSGLFFGCGEIFAGIILLIIGLSIIVYFEGKLNKSEIIVEDK